VELVGGGAGHDGDHVAAEADPEGVVLGGDGDDLTGVHHADWDSLGGNYVRERRLHFADLPSLHTESAEIVWHCR
jgi:hypothetical protein